MNVPVCLMKEVGLVTYFLHERRLRRFRPWTLLSMYNGVILLIFLFSILCMIVGNIFNDNLDKVYTFAALMENSAYVISRSCFLFYTLLFIGKFVFCTCSCLSKFLFISH